MKEIITDYELLTQRSDEINIKKRNDLMRECNHELHDTMRKLNLTALSAPQIGYNCRIFCIKFGERIKTFINPVITNGTGLTLSRETCHSVPGKTFIRPRSNKITMMLTNPLGKVETVELAGLSAIVAQHQVDHLDGLLISDIGMEIDDDFDNASEEERAEIINEYIDALDLAAKEAKEIAVADEDAKKLLDAIEFNKAVQEGKVQFDDELAVIEKEPEENNTAEEQHE